MSSVYPKNITRLPSRDDNLNPPQPGRGGLFCNIAIDYFSYLRHLNWSAPTLRSRDPYPNLNCQSQASRLGVSGFLFPEILLFPPTNSVMERTTQSSTKRQKVSDAEQNNPPSVDRLSTLPDGILCHILSFLPITMSVATSIIAKRWMLLWAHVPDLRFEDKISSDVIYTVMLLHKAKIINTFSIISYAGHYNELQLDTWIKIAIERNVRNLVFFHPKDKLPRCIFTCKTLVELCLSYCKFNPSRGPISLPSLQKLHLDRIDFQETNFKSFPRFLSGCPMLEELIIKDTIDPSLDPFDISSPTIKRLTVDFPLFLQQFNEIEYRVVIDAPALEYLKIINLIYGQIKILPMPSLLEADVCLYNDPITLFKCLRNVKYLKLSGCFKESELCNLEEFIDRGVDGPCVRFDNLTKLELEADCRFLTKILENADNLQVLTIHECQVSDYLKNWREPKEEWRACLLNSLRKVTIRRFQSSEGGFNLVRFLLGNARVLRRMEIHSDHLKDKFGALQKISLFHRESRECEVAFF